MSSFTSNESASSINPTSSPRRCHHGAYGPICMCTSNIVMPSISSSTSNESTPSIKPTSSTRRCRHGSYGPMCMCSSSAVLPPSSSAAKAVAHQPANIEAEPTASVSDQIRAMFRIKVHKRCSHGSYGPTCVCDFKVAV
jgi:hypothetical protein